MWSSCTSGQRPTSEAASTTTASTPLLAWLFMMYVDWPLMSAASTRNVWLPIPRPTQCTCASMPRCL